jgi:hypothetical protein
VAFIPSGNKKWKSQDGIESNGEKHNSKVSPQKKTKDTKKTKFVVFFFGFQTPNLGYVLGFHTPKFGVWFDVIPCVK